MAFNLKKVLKALLFSSSQPLATKDIQAALTRFHETASALALGATPEAGDVPPAVPTPPTEDAVEIAAELPGDAELYHEVPSLITATQIREAMDQIAAEMHERNEGLLLIEGSAGYRLVTHPQYARWVRALRNEPPPLKLSPSSVETLAIVAYRQPVTRAEVETIRGVSAEAGINKLLERGLIYVVGRADLPGRPIQYGTTDFFLEFTGIKSLDELPASDVLCNRQIDDWLQSALNPTKPPTDVEMGLPLETSEGDSPNFEPVTVEHAHVAPAASPAVKSN
jgi:segregation and condensation protein B